MHPLPYFPDLPDEDPPAPCRCRRPGCFGFQCDGDDSWIADAAVPHYDSDDYDDFRSRYR